MPSYNHPQKGTRKARSAETKKLGKTTADIRKRDKKRHLRDKPKPKVTRDFQMRRALCKTTRYSYLAIKPMKGD